MIYRYIPATHITTIYTTAPKHPPLPCQQVQQGATSLVLPNLVPGTAYTVRVAAYNAQGYGPFVAAQVTPLGPTLCINPYNAQGFVLCNPFLPFQPSFSSFFLTLLIPLFLSIPFSFLSQVRVEGWAEIQAVQVNSQQTFTLQYTDQSGAPQGTGTLPVYASASQVQDALQRLGSGVVRTVLVSREEKLMWIPSWFISHTPYSSNDTSLPFGRHSPPILSYPLRYPTLFLWLIIVFDSCNVT